MPAGRSKAKWPSTEALLLCNCREHSPRRATPNKPVVAREEAWQSNEAQWEKSALLRKTDGSAAGLRALTNFGRMAGIVSDKEDVPLANTSQALASKHCSRRRRAVARRCGAEPVLHLENWEQDQKVIRKTEHHRGNGCKDSRTGFQQRCLRQR